MPVDVEAPAGAATCLWSEAAVWYCFAAVSVLFVTCSLAAFAECGLCDCVAVEFGLVGGDSVAVAACSVAPAVASAVAAAVAIPAVADVAADATNVMAVIPDGVESLRPLSSRLGHGSYAAEQCSYA